MFNRSTFVALVITIKKERTAKCMQWLTLGIQLVILVLCYRALKWVVRKYKGVEWEKREAKKFNKIFDERQPFG
jgi:hypothetical protein